MADFEGAPLKDVIDAWDNWANNLEIQLRHNFETQKIFPLGWPGPYPGYAAINAKKNGAKEWKSTGDAFRQLYSQVYRGASGRPELIYFFFKYHMMFADMGVGKGTKYPQVDNAAKAHWGRLYKKWGNANYDGRKVKKSKVESVKTPVKLRSRRSRPHLMMEFRHQWMRLELIVTEYYSRKGIDDLYRVIMGMEEE